VFEFLVGARRQAPAAAFDSADDQHLSEELQRAGGRTSRGTARSAA